jgi:hypothetical protein
MPDALRYGALIHLRWKDDTLLGVTWRDLAQSGVFGGLGHLGKYAKTRQPPQVACQVLAKSNAISCQVANSCSCLVALYRVRIDINMLFLLCQVFIDW